MTDFWNETAKRCHNMPDGWQWFALDASDAPPGYVKVTGSVPIGIVKSGTRKGKPRWGSEKDADKLWMKRSDIAETERLWEIETGKCGKCEGKQRTPKRLPIRDDDDYKTCEKCNGTGKPND